MATTYALPVANGHGVGHAHSHSRKSATQRLNLQATSINEGHQENGGPTITDFLTPQMAPQHQSHKSNDIYYETRQEQTAPFPQLSLPNPSFSTPTYGRTKSMERRKSAGLPTHLHLQGNGYGFPAPTAQRFRANTIEPGASIPWITTAEAISSILIPLPYVLASITYKYFITSHGLEGQPNHPEALHVLISGWPITCGMTSVTLLLVGFRGFLGKGYRELDRRKKSLGGDDTMMVQKRRWGDMARRMTGRFLSIGLPFYATSKLGAARVALVMLIGLASNIMAIEDEAVDLTRAKTWRLLFGHRRWTVGSVVLQLVCDLAGLTNSSALTNISLGYLAVGLSLFVVPPPFPSTRPKVSLITSSVPTSEASTSTALPTPWEAPPQLQNNTANVPRISPLISSPEDVELTLWGGTVLGLFSIGVFSFLGPSGGYVSPAQLGCSIVASSAAALTLTTADPRSLRSNKGVGLVLGSLLSSIALAQLGIDLWSTFVYQSIFISISFAATIYDTPTAPSFSSHSNHQHHHDETKSHTTERVKMSKFSDFVLRNSPNWQLLHSILVEKDSRRIFYFMCLNFAFMLIQTFYGVATGSLGLLSDSIHMFFDCIALVVGLCAAVMSKWPPSTRFPYGYGKMDTLAGFANGIFLMLISIEIIYEAIERLAEGSHINKLGELLTVSTLGLTVNLVGLLAFGHAHHGHSHGGHSHGEHSHAEHDCSSHSHAGHQQENEHIHRDHSDHDHSHHDHSHHDYSHHDHSHRDHLQDCSPQKHFDQPPSAHAHLDHLQDHSAGLTPNSSVFLSVPATPSKPLHPHSHAHGHGSNGHGHHDHGNENMQGIFLHVMADTLGSAAVIVSTLLIYFFGWSGFDPLASCFIAILIFASAIPLVTSSARTLLLTVPADIEYDLREALAGLSGLRGVVSYAVPKFWLEEGGDRKVLGVIHVIAGKAADTEDVRQRAVLFLLGRNMDVLVQVEREGDGRCWCKAQK